mmetsp:Transcript_58286/g.185750  ORF Transcript_58286/g.185750 Transcript_58286/m.185750 type:complete len:471 (-) Transcript_58286:508-1920(-)
MVVPAGVVPAGLPPLPERGVSLPKAKAAWGGEVGSVGGGHSSTLACSLRADLVSASRSHRALLKAVHAAYTSGSLDLYRRGADLEAALIRYRGIWLPILDHHQGHQLGTLAPPPLDVAWAWHLHRLDPHAYERDCIRTFGRLLSPPVGFDPFSFTPFGATDEDGLVSGQWSAFAGGEPYHPRAPGGVAVAAMEAADKAVVSCDLVASATRQSTFLWQVRWAEYEDPAFLARAARRYELMLGLMKRHPRQFVVPTYDMDLMWHTHMAFPADYAADTARLAGRVVGHDDSVNERGADTKLTVSTGQTSRIWEAAYGAGEPWATPGGMFRGPPAGWYWRHTQKISPPASPLAMVGAPGPVCEAKKAWEVPGAIPKAIQLSEQLWYGPPPTATCERTIHDMTHLPSTSQPTISPVPFDRPADLHIKYYQVPCDTWTGCTPGAKMVYALPVGALQKQPGWQPKCSFILCGNPNPK